jgi:hypothetical protein
VAAVCAVAMSPVGHAAARTDTIVVDDNRVQCRDADIDTIADALTAARRGDTVQVRPTSTPSRLLCYLDQPPARNLALTYPTARRRTTHRETPREAAAVQRGDSSAMTSNSLRRCATFHCLTAAVRAVRHCAAYDCQALAALRSMLWSIPSRKRIRLR